VNVALDHVTAMEEKGDELSSSIERTKLDNGDDHQDPLDEQ
jgi:hypothetical protein